MTFYDKTIQMTFWQIPWVQAPTQDMSFDDLYGYNIIKNSLRPIFLEQNVSNEASLSSLLDLIDNYGCNCDYHPIIMVIT